MPGSTSGAPSDALTGTASSATGGDMTSGTGSAGGGDMTSGLRQCRGVLILPRAQPAQMAPSAHPALQQAVIRVQCQSRPQVAISL